MRFWEAMKALEEGKKVRCKQWIGKNAYVCKKSIADSLLDLPINEIERYLNGEWELYEEPEKRLNFSQVVEGLKQGKKFRRKSWKGDMFLSWCPISGFYTTGIGNHFSCLLPTMDLFDSMDWIEVH